MEKSKTLPQKSKPKKKSFSIFPWEWSGKEEKPVAKASPAKTSDYPTRQEPKSSTGKSLPPLPAPRSKPPKSPILPPRQKVSQQREAPLEGDRSAVVVPRTPSPSPKTPVILRPTQSKPASSTCSSNHSSVPFESVKNRRYSELIVAEDTTHNYPRSSKDGQVHNSSVNMGLRQHNDAKRLPATVAPAAAEIVSRPRTSRPGGARPVSEWSRLTADERYYRNDYIGDPDRNVPAHSDATANLTFESAVLALIRLRRVETQLHQNRNRYVRELELFRGCNNERYIYILEQIAKSNLQMDELDPLIASLETFIKEQQTPFFIPEDQVVRYPATADPRSGYAAKLGSHQNGTISGLPRKSAGYSDWMFEDGNLDNKLAVKNALDVDRELDNLRRQVRDLQVERRKWLHDGKKAKAKTDVEDEYSTDENDGRSRGRMTSKNADRTLVESNQNGMGRPVNSIRQRSASETRETAAPQFTRMFKKNPQDDVKATSGSSSAASCSDEISVDEPYHDRYEDFNASHIINGEFDVSLSKLQDIMDELEKKPVTRKTPSLNCFNTHSDRDSPPAKKAPAKVAPPAQRKNQIAGRQRRHHTISSATSRDILAAAKKYADENPYATGNMIYPRKNPNFADPEEISYDVQMRLDSPDKIFIPERYLDDEIEPENAKERTRRLMKAEDIRRMLATPTPGVTDREQRDREKVLLMTPILAREVTERSRKVALRAQKRNAL